MLGNTYFKAFEMGEGMRNIPWEYIDIEMRPLIKEINNMGCVQTIGCCIGHGVDPIGTVIFKVVDETAWKDLMMDLLKLNFDLKESNIDIFQWYRLDNEGNYLVDWKLDIEAHPRPVEERDPEEDRLKRIKNISIQRIIEVINKR